MTPRAPTATPPPAVAGTKEFVSVPASSLLELADTLDWLRATMREVEARVADTIRCGEAADFGAAYRLVVSAAATALLFVSPLTAQGRRVRQRAACERATGPVESVEEAIVVEV